MRVHASILIQRRIDAVFAYLSTPDHLPGWIAGVAAADGPPPDRLGVGAMLVVQSTVPRSPARSTWEVTAYEPPHALALRGLDDAGGVEVRWTLEGTAGEATRVWVEADVQVLSFFRPEVAHLEELGAGHVNEQLEVLRRRLEDGAGERAR